jgi:hypothetical protein
MNNLSGFWIEMPKFSNFELLITLCRFSLHKAGFTCQGQIFSDCLNQPAGIPLELADGSLRRRAFGITRIYGGES